MTENRVLTDPYEYTGATDAQIGYGKDAVESDFLEYRSKDGQLLNLYKTRPLGMEEDESLSTVIMPASHDYRLEPLWMKRADILASNLGVEVVAVDTPGTVGLLKPDGVGGYEAYDETTRLDGASQTMGQLVSALSGNFTPHAKLQLEAVSAVTDLDKSKDIYLFGESMGASVSVDMMKLAQEAGLPVTAVVLYEMVNIFKKYDPSKPLGLMKTLPGIENDRRNIYLNENKDIGHPQLAFEMTSERNARLDKARKGMGQQGVASAVNGLGMAKGRLDDIIDNSIVSGVDEVHLFRGAQSNASLRKDYDLALDAMRWAGVDVYAHDVYDRAGSVDMGHSHLVSLGRQADVASYLKKIIS